VPETPSTTSPARTDLGHAFVISLEAILLLGVWPWPVSWCFPPRSVRDRTNWQEHRLQRRQCECSSTPSDWTLSCTIYGGNARRIHIQGL